MKYKKPEIIVIFLAKEDVLLSSPNTWDNTLPWDDYV